MEIGIIEKPVNFYELKWDTDYFGVKSAKAILSKPLNLSEWDSLKRSFGTFQFISIENRNSEPINAQLIARDTVAVLIDVNIQFRKVLKGSVEMPEGIEVTEAQKPDNQITDIANFKFSKFIEDPELLKRGGGKVYSHWLANSFEKSGKYYALSRDKNDEIDGFLLHSYTDNTCVVELIAVSENFAQSGIGTRLFRAVEYAAYERGCYEIRVGTQVRNLGAINFYHKVGCKQEGCHQVYHLWNL